MTQQLDFKISSGLKNIIGKELITNDLIAIFELVKNSYDATANKVDIVFQNIRKTDKKAVSMILIIDDGDGMSFDDLRDKWLFVGYSDKKEFEKALTKDYRGNINVKRIFAGAKGIGRFSCDRLGKNLRLITKKKDDKQYNVISLDWTRFEEDQKKEFQNISVSYERTNTIDIDYAPIKGFKKGTILEISHLNDGWDSDKLIKLKKYLQRLINPSSTDSEGEFKINLVANEFERENKKENINAHNIINGPVKNVVFEKLDIKTTQITTTISNGKIITELIDKGVFIFKLVEKSDYPKLNDIIARVFYLNRAAKHNFTGTMGMEPVKYGSIFLYKNNFRIHPYGDEGDDWLGLEKRKVQGYGRFLSARELIGRIELKGSQPNFMEVSSRDGGVIKTDAYYDLQSLFFDKVLRRLEKYVVEGIEWDSEKKDKPDKDIKKDSIELIQKIVGQVKDPEKSISFNADLLDIFREKQVEKIPEIIKNVESIAKYVSNPKERDYIEKQVKSIRFATYDLEKDKESIERDLKAKERESLFLSKMVSTDKDVIVNLNHTIENSTVAVKGIIKQINKNIKDRKPISTIAPLVDVLALENDKIRVLAGFVSQANFNLKTEWITKDIIQYIKEYLEMIKTKSLRFRFIGAEAEYITRFKPLEISILLDNLLSNSKKAEASTITISYRIAGKRLHIYIADDGRGVDQKFSKYVFLRGYTTTNGAGIGLHHIKTIVEAMGGSVSFLGNNYTKLGKGACWEVVLK